MFKKPLLIIGLFVILAAIPLTVFLSQQQQEIRQRASEPPPTNGESEPPPTNGESEPPPTNGESEPPPTPTSPPIGGGPSRPAGDAVSPVGYFDAASCTSFTGWSRDADSPSTALEINFWLEKDKPNNNDLTANVFLGAVTANRPRPDLQTNAGFSDINHGFSFDPHTFQTQQALFVGRNRSITAFGINVDSSGRRQDYDTGRNILHSGLTNIKTVNCSTPITPTPTPTSPPPTASITGPSTGTIGQNLTYNAQFSIGNSATVFVSRSDNNTFTCPPGIFTDSAGRKWCIIGTLSGNGTTVFTPRETGTYAVLVNAYANSTATFTASRATECTGNPFGLNPTQQAQWSDCGPNDNIQLTVSAPTPTSPPIGGANRPIVTFTANPQTLASGREVTLTWSSTNATKCVLNPPGVYKTVESSGTDSFSPTQTTIYNIRCEGPGGSTTASTTVTVTAAPSPPNCTISGPQNLTVGETRSYNATATVPQGGDANVEIDVNTVQSSNGLTRLGYTDCGNSNNTCSLNNVNFTPTQAGTYYIFCRGYNDALRECRPFPPFTYPADVDCGTSDNIQVTVSAAQPTSPPTPTTTPVPGSTTLDLAFNLQGVGPTSSPRNSNRELKVEIFDNNNRLVRTERPSATFQNGIFKGTLDLGTNFTSGAYVIKLKANNTLRRLVENVTTITAGTTNSLKSIEFISGDLTNDNELDAIDYANLVGCLDIKKGRLGYNCPNPTLADLNDNGSVDLQDLSILIFNFSHRQGD